MSDQTLVPNDNATFKRPFFFRASFIAALLALATPVLAVVVGGIWDRVSPSPQPEWYESAPMTIDWGRAFAVLFYALVWWLTMDALGIVLAIIGAVRRERGQIKFWAIGTVIAALVLLPLLMLLKRM